MAPELVPLCSIDLQMGDMSVIGEGPAGLRVVAQVAGGTVTGERLSGTVLGPSTADWVVLNANGVATVDVRATVRTDTGALVYATYGGRIDMSQGPGTAPIYVAPTFETGDPDLAWLNLVQAVGIGQLDGDALHYDWFELRVR
jgi:hypothetical protein